MVGLVAGLHRRSVNITLNLFLHCAEPSGIFCHPPSDRHVDSYQVLFYTIPLGRNPQVLFNLVPPLNPNTIELIGSLRQLQYSN
jgi:hypothetical protein